VLASDWYRERLRAKQNHDIALWTRHVKALETFDWQDRLAAARAQLSRVASDGHLAELAGTIGADPVAIRP
jgi:hypothetical protein